jgi:YihY family inner membrane protein
MNGIIDRIDALQRRYRVSSFLWAVQKKYSDDRGGYLAALVTYYGFLSIFPLLLAAFTVIAYALSGDHSAAASLERHIGSYPIINQAASGLDKGTVHGSAVALVIGVLGLVWGSQGLAQTCQFAMDEAWNVPNKSRPGFLPRTLRSFGWYGAFGTGALVSTFVSSLGQAFHWAGGDVLSTAASFLLDIGLFLLSFWILTPPGIAVRTLVPGAVAAGAAWAVLTGVGVGLTTHLAHSNPLYGSFATVIGLLALIYLNARITILCIESNVVRHQHLWPRALTSRNLTEADHRQLKGLAAKEERVAPEEVHVHI